MFARQLLSATAAGLALPDLPALPDRRAVANPELYVGAYSHVGGARPGFRIVADGGRLYLEQGAARFDIWQAEDAGIVIDHPDLDRLPLHIREIPGGGRVARHGAARYVIDGAQHTPDAQGLPHDERGDVTGHYRSYGSVWTNFRVCTGWDGALLLVHQSGKEERLTRLGAATWRVEDTPETLHFDTFIEGRAARANFSGCDFYRTFTP